VLEIGLGRKLNDFLEGKMQLHWKDFNNFFEWYFEIEELTGTLSNTSTLRTVQKDYQ
jgi:hypothetical protein